MDLKEQFEKETGNDPWFEDDKTGLMGLTQDYVDWLESKLNNNEVIDLVSKSSLDKTKKKKFKHNHKVCGCGRPYSQKDLEDGMCNKCCAPTM